MRCFAFRNDTLNCSATVQTELAARDHGVESVVGLDVEYEAAEAVVEEGDVFCFAKAFVVVWGVTAALRKRKSDDLLEAWGDVRC